MAHDIHASKNHLKDQKENEIAKEMLPFFIHIAWPVLIIAIIAKIFAPSSF